MSKVLCLISVLALSIVPSSPKAHEVWLDPAAFQLSTGETIAIDLVNGEQFEGSSQIYNRNSFVRFEHHVAGTTTDIPGRLGDKPVARLEDATAGLHRVVYQSTSSWLIYNEWDAFLRFARHKDFPEIEARHRARGLPRTGFVESYARFAKTLVAVGGGDGSDSAVGFDTEIVALANPYTDNRDTVPVRVLYLGAPRVGVQVEVFERAPDGKVTITLLRTNGMGEAEVPVKAGHIYLIDAVVLREPKPDLLPRDNAVWETLWASLTFAVPE